MYSAFLAAKPLNPPNALSRSYFLDKYFSPASLLYIHKLSLNSSLGLYTFSEISSMTYTCSENSSSSHSYSFVKPGAQRRSRRTLISLNQVSNWPHFAASVETAKKKSPLQLCAGFKRRYNYFAATRRHTVKLWRSVTPKSLSIRSFEILFCKPRKQPI